MIYSELAYRYAAALFDVASEAKKADEYLKYLESLQAVIEGNETINEFVASPLVRTEEKVKALQLALKNSGLPEDIISFVTLLGKKSRITILPEIISAYQARADELNGITRGAVRTSAKLSDKQKENIASLISAITKKKVLLQYSVDKSLIGGLTAQVGSLTFDDSLTAHLRRIKEDLTRRIN